MTETLENISVDLEKGKSVLRRVQDAVENKEGIFKYGLKPFLPQWNLPGDLEYSPQRRETINPEYAAKLLYTKNFCDRLQSSSFLMKNITETWINPEKNWIFFPEKVVKKPVEEINDLIKKTFFVVTNKIEMSPGERYLENAKILNDKYGGDPRNLINGKTVQEARDALMKLEGFGTGLANLFIIETYGRNIASPSDPINIRFKVDRHKARLGLNTNIVLLNNGTRAKGTIHATTIVSKLEDTYLKICQEENLESWEVDAALWIIGSQVCTHEKYQACLTNCPLVKHCIANTDLVHESGQFLVYQNGKRLDSREKNNQYNLKF